MSYIDEYIEDVNEIEDQQIYDKTKPRIQGNLQQQKGPQVLQQAPTVQFEEEFIGDDISEIQNDENDKQQQNEIKDLQFNIQQQQQKNQYNKKQSLQKQISEYNIDEDLEDISKNSIKQNEEIKEEDIDYEEELVQSTNEIQKQRNLGFNKQKTNFLDEEVEDIDSQNNSNKTKNQSQEQKENNKQIQNQIQERTPEEEEIYQQNLQKQRILIKITNDPKNLEFFQKIKKNEIVDSLDLMANKLQTDRNQDEQYQQYQIEYIVKQLNRISNSLLNQSKYSSVKLLLDFCKDELELYKKSDCYTELLSLTYNNLGCLHRRTQNLEQGLEYLEQAFKIQAEQNNTKNLGITYLNMGAIYSQQGQHDKALKFAQRAVEKNNQNYQLMGDTGKSFEELKQDLDFQDLARNLSVSFFNVAMEMEFKNNYLQAIQNYESAKQVALDNLGPENKFQKKINKISTDKIDLLNHKQKQAFLEKQRLQQQTPNSKYKKKQNHEINKQTFQKNNNHACVAYVTTPITRNKIDQYAQSYQISQKNFIQKGKKVYIRPGGYIKQEKLQTNPPHPLLRNSKQSSSLKNIKSSQFGLNHQTLTQFLSDKRDKLQNISLQVENIEFQTQLQKEQEKKDKEQNKLKLNPKSKLFTQSSRSVSNSKQGNNTKIYQNYNNVSQSSKFNNSQLQNKSKLILSNNSYSKYQQHLQQQQQKQIQLINNKNSKQNNNNNNNILNDEITISSISNQNQQIKTPNNNKINQNQIKVIQRPYSAKPTQNQNSQNNILDNNNSVDNIKNNQLKNYNTNNSYFKNSNNNQNHNVNFDDKILYEELSQDENSDQKQSYYQGQNGIKRIQWNENFSTSRQILTVQQKTRQKCKPYILELANQMPGSFLNKLQDIKQQQMQEDINSSQEKIPQNPVHNLTNNSQILNKTLSVKKYKINYHKSPRIHRNNFM